MAGNLIIKGISKKFGDYQALQNINAKIFENKITAFIGPNGAGKTTLFNIISGFLKPDKGKIYLEELDITGLPPHRIANLGIGRQFQDIRLFGKLTVLENVILAIINNNEASIGFSLVYPFKKEIKKKFIEKAYHWLEFVGLEGQAKELAENLSYGQQKLLSIARLMAKEFKILLLDEPISGLSPFMVNKMIGLIQKLAEEENKTIAVIEHNMAFVKEIAYWVYFLNEGKIGFSGRVDHILGHEKVREIYMGF